MKLYNRSQQHSYIFRERAVDYSSFFRAPDSRKKSQYGSLWMRNKIQLVAPTLYEKKKNILSKNGFNFVCVWGQWPVSVFVKSSFFSRDEKTGAFLPQLLYTSGTKIAASLCILRKKSVHTISCLSYSPSFLKE